MWCLQMVYLFLGSLCYILHKAADQPEHWDHIQIKCRKHQLFISSKVQSLIITYLSINISNGFHHTSYFLYRDYVTKYCNYIFKHTNCQMELLTEPTGKANDSLLISVPSRRVKKWIWKKVISDLTLPKCCLIIIWLERF